MAEHATAITQKVIGEIMGQAQLVEETFAKLKQNVEKTFEEVDVTNIEKVYYTGCGDSYFAGVAVRYFFEKVTGIQCEAIEALEFSRYHADFMPQNSLLVSISNSGKVSRAIECVIKAKKRGVKTIAVTKYSDSLLASHADYVVQAIIPPMPSGAVGTRSYTASLLGAYLIALLIGRKKGSLSPGDYEQKCAELENLGGIMQDLIESQQSVLVDFVNEHKVEDNLVIIGGGPNYATALFGAAKVLEAVNLDSIPQTMEEWAHLQFHTVYENKYTVVLAPTGRCLNRAVEQIRGINDTGGCVICLSDDESLRDQCAFFIHMPTLPEELTPFLYCIPLEFIATYLSLKLGKSMRMRLDDHLKEVNFRQIFDSAIEYD